MVLIALVLINRVKGKVNLNSFTSLEGTLELVLEGNADLGFTDG